MKPALLDTDVFSEILKGRNRAVRATAKNYRAAFGHITISVITVLEITQGLYRKGQSIGLTRFAELADASEILQLDRPIAEIAGRIFANLDRTGQPIGWADPIIAAIAVHHGLALATGNASHFQRIADLGYGLELQNWREASSSS